MYLSVFLILFGVFHAVTLKIFLIALSCFATPAMSGSEQAQGLLPGVHHGRRGLHRSDAGPREQDEADAPLDQRWVMEAA